ncbi:MAG: tetratricopeptide (TPR) repeat protein/DNA-binding CsgD family transcriptional regulator [Psychroserpens sp.]|jgi:tetratricopeptide (TPR) repeat protein/DNA-binding CsgD family transcriptional regulator
MKLIITKVLILFFFIQSSQLFAQKDILASKIDSLNQVLVKADVENINKINSYLELTKIFIHKNLDLSKIYAEKGKLLAEKSSNHKMTANFLIELARIKEVQNEIEESIAFLNKAAKLYENKDEDNTYLTVCNYQGMYYEMLSNYDKSIEKYLLGLKLSITLNNRMYEAVFLDNLSQVYSKANQFEKSLASILEAIAIYKVIGNKNQYFQAQIYAGNSYIKLGKYDLAKEHLNKAKEFFTKINDHILLADIYAALGKISVIAENQDEALELFLIAQFHALKMRDYNGEQNYKLALINNSLGNTYLYFKSYKKAIEVLKVSEEIGKKIKSIEVLKNSYKGLVLSYMELKKTDSASHYLNLFIPANDSLLAEQYNDKIDAINYDYQLDSEKYNFEIEKKLIVNQKRNQKIFFVLIFSILSLIVLTLVFLRYILKTKYQKSVFQRQNLKLEKEKLTIELEKKEQELTVSILNLVERNEFISKLWGSLKDLSFDPITSNEIQKIIKTITINDSKKLWAEFEFRYVQNNKNFFEKIERVAPNLSSGERRLIALIRLNFSTKEISTITYQSPHSIKIARYRLRKKLYLSKNQNLIAYISSL